MGRPRSSPATSPAPLRLRLVALDKAVPLLVNGETVHAATLDGDVEVRGPFLCMGDNVIPLSRMLSGVVKR